MTTSRRKFLGLAAAGIGLGLANISAPAFAGGERTQASVGVQLYTLRDLMQKSVGETLQRVAETAYSNVELAGYYDHSPTELRRILDAKGLSAPATHIPLDVLDKDFESALAGAQVLGCNYLVLPYLYEHQRRSIDDYKRLADKMNRWGEACQKAGGCMRRALTN